MTFIRGPYYYGDYSGYDWPYVSEMQRMARVDRDRMLYGQFMVEMKQPESWLKQAEKMTTEDRRKHYGHPLPNFIRIALGWIVIFDVVLTPLQVAQGMITLKMARDVNMYKEDDWIDTIGYSNTVQMMDERMKNMGYDKGIEYFSDFKDGVLASKLHDILVEHKRRFPKSK